MNLRHVLFVLMTLLPFTAAHAEEPAKIAPAAAAKLVASGDAVLVDVREPSEWQDTGVVTGAALLPKSDFDATKAQWKSFLAQNRDKEIILYCRSGKRAGVIGTALAAQGFKVANAGGFADWAAAGLPTKKYAGEKP